MKNNLTKISLLFVIAILGLTTGCNKMTMKTDVVFDNDTTWVDNTTKVAEKPEAPKVVEITFGDVVEPIYFDYNSYELSPSSVDVLKKIGEFLEKNASTKIKIEGNTDERGTQGYNQALGQKRAEAVKNYFKNFGISSSRLSTISYGELKPAVEGTSEDAYAKNRRCEMEEK